MLPLSLTLLGISFVPSGKDRGVLQFASHIFIKPHKLSNLYSNKLLNSADLRLVIVIIIIIIITCMQRIYNYIPETNNVETWVFVCVYIYIYIYTYI